MSENMKQDQIPCCGEEAPHEELLSAVNAGMPDEEMLYDLAELYKVFGDSTRIKILYALFESELCVCDIARVLSMTQSAISHQLRILKQNRLVKSRREGKSVFYSLADEHVRVLKQAKLVKFRREGKTIFYSLSDDHVRTIIGMGMDHLCE